MRTALFAWTLEDSADHRGLNALIVELALDFRRLQLVVEGADADAPDAARLHHLHIADACGEGEGARKVMGALLFLESTGLQPVQCRVLQSLPPAPAAGV